MEPTYGAGGPKGFYMVLVVLVVPSYGAGGASGSYIWLWWFQPMVVAEIMVPTYGCGGASGSYLWFRHCYWILPMVLAVLLSGSLWKLRVLSPLCNITRTINQLRCI